MIKFYIFLYVVFAVSTGFAEPVAPFPIFLKYGFSAVLEFEAPPTQVVIGDSQGFLVEKLRQSVAIKALNPNVTSNMFVYFKGFEPKIFTLTASDEADPTFYKKFDYPKKKIVVPEISSHKAYRRGIYVVSSRFDPRKEHLTLEFLLSADSSQPEHPSWNEIHLEFKKENIKPKELWSEGKIIQRDSQVKVRLSFYKPDIPRNFRSVYLVVPLENKQKPFVSNLSERYK